MTALGSYIMDMLVMFGISAAAILLLCSLLCWVLAKRITGPIEDISEAARRLGSGDFTARAPVDGCVELADFATTFNNMAMRLQTIDNSRGQFMGNIAHELRTPMTTIKGFIDGMLDGTIPPEENQHYLTIVSQETGRLARLVQNMLDITKLEAGEVPVHARNYDLWKTVTDVVLSDEQRIEDGKIDIQGLGGPPLAIYADPTLCTRWSTTLWTTPSSSPRRAGPSPLRPRRRAIWWRSASKTPAPASRRKRCPLSLSGSTRRTVPVA